MSHRTEELEPLSGVAHLVRELRYHEVARQGLAVVLILLYALTANPSLLWAWIGLPPALLGMLGTGGERTDIWAHAFGLVAGGLLGAAAAALWARPPGLALQLVCGALFALVIVAAWGAAA